MRTAGLLAAALCVLQLGAGAAIAVPAGDEAKSGPLLATLERLGTHVYAGDPVQVRVAVFNTGKTPYDNSKGLDLVDGLVIGDETGASTFKRKPSTLSDRASQPAVIAPGGFFGLIVDLRDLFEGVDKPGRYSVRLALPAVQTAPVHLVVIPKYDPKVAYRAIMETGYGPIKFDLLGKEAPAHVKNFYDLANSGYYDNSYILAIMKGVQIIGGDPNGDGRGTPGYDLPLEIHKDVKNTRGTLAMLRKQHTDHGSQFVISLGNNPMLDGVLSVFGVMASGEDALQALENLPTNGRNEIPHYKPLKDVKIVSIKAEPAPEGSRATAAEGAEAKGAASKGAAHGKDVKATAKPQ